MLRIRNSIYFMAHKVKNNITLRNNAVEIFYSGLDAVEPSTAVKLYCRREDERFFIADTVYELSRFNKLFIIGAGKAAAPMASAMEKILGERITDGAINVKYEHTADLYRVKLVEAGHPVPDENGQLGSRSILNIAKRAGQDDLVICLISGGGSALLPLPFPPLTLLDKQETTNTLLSCGATIYEINAIRKHMSMLKGGRLAQEVHPATLVSLILSDVVGDDLDVIGSGPTVPDPTTFENCMEIFSKYNIIKELPVAVIDHFEAGTSGKIPETPKTGDHAFAKTQNLIIGSNINAIIAAKKKAESLGYNTLILSSLIEGETKHVACMHTAIAREIIRTGNPIQLPACLLSGGETTVKVTGRGLGGRNQEFALAAALDIANRGNILVLSAGTDGTDGPTDAAGAFADTQTIARAETLGLQPANFLENNDSYHFFKHLDDLLITGPTRTNVMDLRIILAA